MHGCMHGSRGFGRSLSRLYPLELPSQKNTGKPHIHTKKTLGNLGTLHYNNKTLTGCAHNSGNSPQEAQNIPIRSEGAVANDWKTFCRWCTKAVWHNG